MKISKRNLVIYILGLAISLLLLGLYFIAPDSPWCIVSCSIGASGIGAVVLAYFIEWSNEKTKEENKRAIRASKLYSIETKAIRLLERIALYYFKKRAELIGEGRKVNCHKISYSELWRELFEQEKYCESLNNIDLEEVTQSTLSSEKSIRRNARSMADHISHKLSEIKMFEAVGYFNSSESGLLADAGFSCYEAAYTSDELDIEGLEMTYSYLTEIKELEFIKDIIIYCKGRYVIHVSAKKKMPDGDKITDDDIKSAITSSDRINEAPLKTITAV